MSPRLDNNLRGLAVIAVSLLMGLQYGWKVGVSIGIVLLLFVPAKEG